MLPREDSTYFPSYQPNSTPKSTLRKYSLTFTTVKSTLAPSHIIYSVPLFETDNITNSPPGLLPPNFTPDLSKLGLIEFTSFDQNYILSSLQSLFPSHVNPDIPRIRHYLDPQIEPPHDTSSVNE